MLNTHYRIVPYAEKSVLDTSQLKNFRPVLNLLFLSKLLETTAGVSVWQQSDIWSHSRLFAIMTALRLLRQVSK